jgi:molybdenum cofactor cytidylyltransferase
MIIAIVPAAGKSERMGQPKLLLPLGGRCVIEHVLAALTNSRVDRTVVVVPPNASELVAVIRRFPVDVAQLASPTSDMRSSVMYGLEFAEQILITPEPKALLVALADQPTLSSRLIDRLIDRSRATDKTILIPTYCGKRGHPVLFSWSLASQIRAIPSDCGLNWLFKQRGNEVEECPVDDAGSLVDLDTPEDYERLRRSDGHAG